MSSPSQVSATRTYIASLTWLHHYFLWSNIFPILLDWIYAGNIELLNLLFSKGVNVESQSDAGTPLIWAAGHGQEESVQFLLEHHANVSCAYAS